MVSRFGLTSANAPGIRARKRELRNEKKPRPFEGMAGPPKTSKLNYGNVGTRRNKFDLMSSMSDGKPAETRRPFESMTKPARITLKKRQMKIKPVFGGKSMEADTKQTGIPEVDQLLTQRPDLAPLVQKMMQSGQQPTPEMLQQLASMPPEQVQQMTSPMHQMAAQGMPFRGMAPGAGRFQQRPNGMQGQPSGFPNQTPMGPMGQPPMQQAVRNPMFQVQQPQQLAQPVPIQPEPKDKNEENQRRQEMFSQKSAIANKLTERLKQDGLSVTADNLERAFKVHGGKAVLDVDAGLHTDRDVDKDAIGGTMGLAAEIEKAKAILRKKKLAQPKEGQGGEVGKPTFDGGGFAGDMARLLKK